MKIVLHQEISAPIETVFSVFTNFADISKNLSAVTRVEFLEGEAQPIVGMRWRETRTMFGKEVTEEMYISGIDAPHSYEVLSESHGTKYKTTFEFAEEDKTTMVSMKFEAHPQTRSAKLASIFGVLFLPATKKSLQKDLMDLKVVAERG